MKRVGHSPDAVAALSARLHFGLFLLSHPFATPHTYRYGRTTLPVSVHSSCALRRLGSVSEIKVEWAGGWTGMDASVEDALALAFLVRLPTVRQSSLAVLLAGQLDLLLVHNAAPRTRKASKFHVVSFQRRYC